MKKSNVNHFEGLREKFNQAGVPSVRDLILLAKANKYYAGLSGYCARNLFPNERDGSLMILHRRKKGIYAKVLNAHLPPVRESEGKKNHLFYSKKLQKVSKKKRRRALAALAKKSSPYADVFPIRSHNSSRKKRKWLHYSTQLSYKSGDVDAERVEFDYYLKRLGDKYYLKVITRRVMSDPSMELSPFIAYCVYE